MNGIENITRRISGDAQKEIDGILTNARQEADAIKARYEQQAKKESADLLQRGAAAAEERQSRLKSAADMAAHQQQLAVRQEMLDKAFDLALEKLKGLPEDNYIALLAQLAVKAADTGRGQLIFNQADRTRYGVKVASAANEALQQAGLEGSLTLSEKAGVFQGGLILQNGPVEVDCTFETMLRLGRSRLAKQTADILFS